MKTLAVAALAVATLLAFYAYVGERSQSRQLGSDLYALCNAVRDTVPASAIATPTNPTRLQVVFTGACEMRNGDALYEAQERAFRRK